MSSALSGIQVGWCYEVAGPNYHSTTHSTVFKPLCDLLRAAAQAQHLQAPLRLSPQRPLSTFGRTRGRQRELLHSAPC